MVFTSYLFIFYFLPLVLLTYNGLAIAIRAVGWSRSFAIEAQNALLLLASYVFYGWWNPRYIPLMFGMTTVNYVCGRIIGQASPGTRRRFAALLTAIIVSLGTLGFSKYFMFLQANLNPVFEHLGIGTFRILEVVLPMGISFYTFQALSYTIDVYRNDARPARSFLDFAAYIALFPQLVAGPIVRYTTVASELVDRSPSWKQFASGVALFCCGFAKKILLANSVSQIADVAFNSQSLTAADAWFGAVAYAFQIYFDFAGYSDMAVGLGRMFGFEFLKNFDAPYHAESITDFWRRWHISLSTFLRDYLYLPLGGNRHGAARTYFNLTVVMLLGGLWHGANWTFVAWGAYHGGLLAMERWLGKRSPYDLLPRPLRVLLTFVLVLFSWVLFRSPHWSDAERYFAAMFGREAEGTAALLLPMVLYSRASLFWIAIAVVVLNWNTQAHEWSETITWPKAVLALILFWGSLMAMLSQSSNPFLYFQF